MSAQEDLAGKLPPEVVQFVMKAYRGLEQENVFDAPGVISGILRQMRVADSSLIRRNVGPAEVLLKKTFARGYLQRVGA